MYRIGIGFDVHELVENRDLILGGVQIPFEKGLLGHSDADALLHALCDALLGALGLGDLGTWFPDNDPKYQNISSLLLLKEVYEKVRESHWELVNMDAILMAQRPKLMPFLDTMKLTIADALSSTMKKISIKATTTEKLGFIGREEGIAAQVVVMLRKLT